MLSSCDRKWDAINTELLKARYRTIDNNIVVTAGDSGQYKNVKNNWMPGGTAAMLLGK